MCGHKLAGDDGRDGRELSGDADGRYDLRQPVSPNQSPRHPQTTPNNRSWAEYAFGVPERSAARVSRVVVKAPGDMGQLDRELLVERRQVLLSVEATRGGGAALLNRHVVELHWDLHCEMV